MSSSGNNVIGNTTGSSGWIGSDQQNVNPLLNALANNGGFTNTHALQAASPAINAGSATNAPLIDQRSYLRNVGAVDVGAYEYGATPLILPGITVSAISGNTTEAGGTATFTIVLDSAPNADVTIGLTSSDTTEGAVGVGSVTFTSDNWNTPQTVTVTGVDDSLDDGDIAFTIVSAAASSADGNYDGLNGADVTVTNIDNDTFNTIFVDTTSDVSDGTTTSIAALVAAKGADGKISLREAIEAANATAGTDRIYFNIADALVDGAHTINVLSALPSITEAVILDGSTEPDFAGTP
ncbi:MAG: hypothetical protein HYV60_16310, partial [Planctomycetia bacterium]|nr:hypothetical protein [Planctomycetia bacterium]